MKKYLFLILIAFAPTHLFAETCDTNCKEKLVRAYFNHLEIIYREGSQLEDIDALFQIFHLDVKYEHVEYQADFDFESWKEAFISNLNRGSYRNKPVDSIKITKMINGKNHMAVEYGYGKVDKNGQWMPGENTGLLILFGFKEGKISLVREYW